MLEVTTLIPSGLQRWSSMLTSQRPALESVAPPPVAKRSTTAQHSAILQQRLLLLNHAINCAVIGSQTCPVSRHCGYMRKLWPHLLQCTNQLCAVAHCLSSRYVLTHYGNCSDPFCVVCPRVRESAKREACTDCPLESPSGSKKQRTSFWWSSDCLSPANKVVISLGRPPLSNPSNKSRTPFLDKLNQQFNDMAFSRAQAPSGQAPTARPHGTTCIADCKSASVDSASSSSFMSISSTTDSASLRSSRSSSVFARLGQSSGGTSVSDECVDGEGTDGAIGSVASVDSSAFDSSNCSYQSSAAASPTPTKSVESCGSETVAELPATALPMSETKIAVRRIH
jgi:hypothetical protein